jgi:hypothetical protein
MKIDHIAEVSNMVRMYRGTAGENDDVVRREAAT